MWKTSLCIDKKEKINQCLKFMSNTDVFESFMISVINEWPVSCEANFTNSGINQVAWLGQAACAIGIECPEDIVRDAWAILDKSLADLANSAAKRQIKKWKDSYLEKNYA